MQTARDSRELVPGAAALRRGKAESIPPFAVATKNCWRQSFWTRRWRRVLEEVVSVPCRPGEQRRRSQIPCGLLLWPGAWAPRAPRVALPGARDGVCTRPDLNKQSRSSEN
ncbi:hypothetical protein EWB00_000409 [Schistosoma japonicum]|uniref:Uncharacterized protein n=1 Tax=Schistosoma japonicum TaxID=6182 RepID=A0A4Z2CL02_SCHJA|nr:hypothetical protein EWB00_000409 [Schistosoma japonicum]